MRNRSRHIAVLIAAVSFFGAVGSAHAAECLPPTAFRMSDGRFYNPDTGIIEEDCVRLLNRMTEARQPSEGPALPSATSVPEATRSSLLAAVRRAHQMLQNKIDAEAAEQKKPEIVGSYDVWVDVTLAIWNARTDEIGLVEARKNGVKVKIDTEDPGVGISVKRNNGVNSEFAVDDGEKVVVAVRSPIFKDVTVKKRRPRYQLQDVVYTPYSAALHTSETVALGRDTLRANIAAAAAALRQGGVMSRAFPGRLLADVVDLRLVEAIAVIEHLGEASMLGPNAQSAAESFYVVIALNQDDAYAYSRSSAGARGLVQFIPSTYALMVRRPELGLIKNFEAGMSDPVNAIKAQIAYLDAEHASMPTAVKGLYATDPLRLAEYLAASYNGGGARVRKAVAAYGDGWAAEPSAQKGALQKRYDALFSEASGLKARILAEDDPKVWKPMQQRLNASRAERAQVKAKINALKSSSLRRETAIYVQKLRATLKLLSSPAPPQA